MFELHKLSGSKERTRSSIMGIDLGTTNSAVTIYNAGMLPQLIPIGKNGKFTLQSCVRWDGFENREAIFTVGEDAYNERYKSNVIYSVKRIMGTDEAVDFVMPGSDSTLVLDCAGPGTTLSMTPAQVSAEILKHIAAKVEEFYGRVTKCVITVPAYFNQRQINDTMEAAKLANLECLQILKEPTSASYIYSQLGYATNGSVLIYDLGGGTFDVTLMRFLRRDSIPSKLLTSLKRQYGITLGGNGADVNDQYFCRVLGTYGNMHLGGDDIDKYLGDKLISDQNLNLSEEGKERLYLRCEEFKKSGTFGEDIFIEDTKIHITSTDLDAAVDVVFDKTMEIMSEIDTREVKTIVLVGGSTKSQRIRSNLEKAFPGVEISGVLDPDATVALGAGSVAKAIANDENMMYADVLPLPIGILVDESRVEVCLQKNTSMPYTTQKKFSTLHDNQDQVTIHVFQGLSDDPAKCTYLGRLTIGGVPPAPAGEVCVTVSFILTGQGRLKVISSVAGVNKEEELVIDNIFSVGNIDNPAQVKEGTEERKYQDDFEECFMPLLEANEEAMNLFQTRRDILKMDLDEEDKQLRIQSYEDKIVALLG